MSFIGKIAVVGGGSVGSTLGTGFAAAEHSVVFGVRDPGDESIRERVGDVRVTSVEDALADANAVILAVPGDVVVDVAREHAAALDGIVVVDATNILPAGETSLAEQVAAAAPGARVVKAFNTIGYEGMADPVFDGEAATTFVAGNDPQARQVVRRLASDLGFAPVGAGDLSAAIHLENLARFWIHLSREHGRDVAFRLVSR